MFFLVPCFEPELTNIIVKVPIAWEGKVVKVPVVRGGKVEKIPIAARGNKSPEL